MTMVMNVQNMIKILCQKYDPKNMILKILSQKYDLENMLPKI